MKPKKSLGQNFLNDKNILNKIVECGEICEKDFVLEIGPGTGNLTELILSKKPKKLIVVEKDKELSLKLLKKFKNNIEIINNDILDCFDKLKYKEHLKVFGNLPYNISTKILISFIRENNFYKKYKKFIFVFQKEVADRIIALENTRNYGRLTILTSWKVDKKKIINIPPNSFFPKPKVWSSLITLTPKSKIQTINKVKNLEHITNIFFNNRRKMIKKPMRLLFKDYETIANKIKLDLNLRPQNVTQDKFIEICKMYENLN